MYLAANISNPFVAPFLILAELQAGAWLRRGALHALSLETIRSIDPWSFGADLLVGSLVVGGVLGGARRRRDLRCSRDRPATTSGSRRSCAAPSDRYIVTSITAWEFARGKLRGDPLYRAVSPTASCPPAGRSSTSAAARA